MEIEPETYKFNVLNVFQRFSKNGDNLLSLLKNYDQIIVLSWNFAKFEKLSNFLCFWANAFHNTTFTHQKWWFMAILTNRASPKLVQKRVSLDAVVKCKSNSVRIFTLKNLIYLQIRPPFRGGPSNLAMYWTFASRLFNLNHNSLIHILLSPCMESPLKKDLFLFLLLTV